MTSTLSPPWYDAYPKPRNTSPESITRSDLLQRLRSGHQPGKDFLLIDLRRTDHEVCPSIIFNLHPSLDPVLLA
jgi:arsenical-resistance protein 2